MAAFLLLAVRVGSSESAQVTLQAPSAWLATAVNGTVVQANAIDGAILARVDIGESGHSIAAVNVRGGVVVLDRNDSEVRGIDSVSLQVNRRVATDPDGRLLDLFGNDDNVFLADADEIHVLDPATLATIQTVDVGAFVSSGVVDADGTLWGRDDFGTNLLRVTADSFTRSTIAPGDSVFTSNGRAYLASSITHDIAGLAGGGSIASCLPAELGELLVAAGPADEEAGPILVTDSAGSMVVVVHPESSTCESVVLDPPIGQVNAVAVDGGYGYFVDRAAGSIWTMHLPTSVEAAPGDIERLAVGRRDADSELVNRDGTVWFNEIDGSSAAVLDGGDLLTVEKVSFAAPDSDVGIEAENGDLILVPTDSGGVAVSAALDEAADAAEGDGSSGAIGGVAVQEVVEAQPVAETDPEPSAADELDANFSYSANVVRVGETISFSDRSTGNPSSWIWTFGDGTSVTGPEATHSWSQEGVYQVVLTVDRPGATSTESLAVTVLPIDSVVPPTAAFTLSSSLVAVGQQVRFASTSTGSPTSLLWTFDDGLTSGGSTTAHSWSQPGSYTVTLVATNNIGSSRASANITVVPAAGQTPPAVTIAASATSVSSGTPIEFTAIVTGSATSITWSFSDGTSDSGPRVRHAFSAPGTYTATVTAANAAGAATDTVSIVVDPGALAPTARFVWSPTSPVTGQTVTFTSISSNNPTTLTWSFDDGTSATGATATRAFTTARTYRISLTATNAAGSDTASVNLVVGTGAVAPDARFTVNPAAPRVGDIVQFVDTSTGAPTSWQWATSDGQTSSVQNPTRVFTAPGSYQVTLTASNAAGVDSATATVVVLPAVPVANFTITPAVPRSGVPAQFTDTSSGSPTTWLWNFGDASTSTLRNPAHTFVAAGTYTVTLTVTGPGGTNSKAQVVVVSPPAPVANFTAVPSPADVGQVVVFNSTSSTGTITQWFWVFGDATTSTLPNPAKIYTAAGNYDVVLTVTGPGGTDTQNRRIVVRQPTTQASFTASPNPAFVGDTVTFTNTSTGGGTWSWNFGDTGTANTQHATHAYLTAGVFPVTLTATGPGGPSVFTVPITITNRPPVAAFAFLPAAPLAGQTVTFTNTSTGSTSWSWNFGDTGTATAQHPAYVFAAAGVYPVTLTATGPGGTNAVTVNITIGAQPPPVAGFTFLPGAPLAGELVSFTDTSTGATGWSWDFGDGGVATSQNPNHNYAAAGVYTVTLTVTGPGGSDVHQVVVTVS